MDLIPFLANIISVSHSDGKLSAAENSQLEAIRSELNFKKSDFAKASKIVEMGNYQLTPVGSFTDQVKNLECILRIAYADDELDAHEVELVSAFCQLVGIYQDQLDKIAADVLSTLQNLGKICASCGSQASKDALYCPNCGAGLSDSDGSVQLAFEIPDKGISIEFSDSSSTTFPKALEIAKISDGYQTCIKLKKNWHLAYYKSGSVLEALPIAETLSGTRNRRAFLNGTEVPWEELFGFMWCSTQRSRAYRPVEYCFGKDQNRINPWGCRHSQMDWVEWSEWFKYGRWEKGGPGGAKAIWRFDKERIRHELATRLFRYRYCPYLNTGLAEAVIHNLPDTIAPEIDKDWKFNQNYEEIPNSIKVTEREGSGVNSYTRQFWSDGVRPVGHQVLTEILTSAFREIGLDDVAAKVLLK
jgi:uncharacterized tellurite resistance protein B-like protein